MSTNESRLFAFWNKATQGRVQAKDEITLSGIGKWDQVVYQSE